MKEREITFARGDILRKVLEQTGINLVKPRGMGWRPLNLRRGGLHAHEGANLLRKLRGFSQNARLLSSLDEIIEFRAGMNLENVRNVFGKLKSFLPKTGAASKQAPSSWASAMAARSPVAAQQVAEKAGQAVGAAKPAGLAKYAGSLGLAGGGGLATGALLDAANRKPPEEEFMALLDGVIEFKYPASVLESSWRKWKKPSRKTFGTILRRHGGETPQGGRLDKLGNVSPLSRPLPSIAFRFAAKDWVTKYPAEVLQSVWRKIRKPRPSSPIAPSYHSGEYHDTPKWVNKDIKKSRSENRGLSMKLDELIRFADPRPRNPLGEFSPQSSGGPDPNAMATVYKMPQQQQQGGFGGTAATLLTGGALGAIGGSAGKHGYEAAVKWIKKVARKGK